MGTVKAKQEEEANNRIIAKRSKKSERKERGTKI